MFDTAQKLSKFLLEIMTFVSSPNMMGSDYVFIFGGRSFMYITKSNGPGIDHWGTACFIVPQFKKKF